MSLTQKMRSLCCPTYPFSGWLCLVLFPAWAGFLPGAGVLWVFSRSACAPQLRVYLCPSHPSESLDSCLQDRVDRVCIPEPSLWLAERWPVPSPIPANGEGAGITDPHWMGRRGQESPWMDWDTAEETRHQMQKHPVDEACPELALIVLSRSFSHPILEPVILFHYQFPLFSMVYFTLVCLLNSSLPFRNCGTKSLPLTARGSFLRISIQLPTSAMKNPLWHHWLLHHVPVFAVRLCIPKSSAISALSSMH